MDEQYKPVIVDSLGYPNFYDDLSRHHVFLACDCGLLATQAIMVRRPNETKIMNVNCPKCNKLLSVYAESVEDNYRRHHPKAISDVCYLLSNGYGRIDVGITELIESEE